MGSCIGSIQNVGISEGTTDRVICAFCDNRMPCGSSGIVRCGVCKSVSSVGPSAARWRCVFFLILSVFLLGTGIVITAVAHAALPRCRRKYYMYIHIGGAYFTGLAFLVVGIRYGSIRVSYPEDHTALTDEETR